MVEKLRTEASIDTREELAVRMFCSPGISFDVQQDIMQKCFASLDAREKHSVIASLVASHAAKSICITTEEDPEFLHNCLQAKENLLKNEEPNFIARLADCTANNVERVVKHRLMLGLIGSWVQQMTCTDARNVKYTRVVTDWCNSVRSKVSGGAWNIIRGFGHAGQIVQSKKGGKATLKLLMPEKACNNLPVPAWNTLQKQRAAIGNEGPGMQHREDCIFRDAMSRPGVSSRGLIVAAIDKVQLKLGPGEADSGGMGSKDLPDLKERRQMHEDRVNRLSALTGEQGTGGDALCDCVKDVVQMLESDTSNIKTAVDEATQHVNNRCARISLATPLIYASPYDTAYQHAEQCSIFTTIL